MGEDRERGSCEVIGREGKCGWRRLGGERRRKKRRI